MGLILCERHGKQGVESVSGSLWSAMEEKRLNPDDILELSFYIDGIEFPFFGLKEDLLEFGEKIEGGLILVGSEARLEALLGGLKSVCVACLNELREKGRL